MQDRTAEMPPSSGAVPPPSTSSTAAAPRTRDRAGTARTVRASVVGATGYAGGELLRWLREHPAVEIAHLASRRSADRPVREVWPALRELEDRRLAPLDPDLLADDSDVVLLAVPHGAGMELAARLLRRGARVVDLSADFRLRDPATYAAWYGGEHRAPELLAEAAYGLPELFRERISSARLVANPGCYPTAVALALLPLARAGVLDGGVSVDAKSGASGAGRSPAAHTTFVEVSGNLRPYGVGEHRHAPEIEQTLGSLGADGGVFFAPHLVPMSRGLLASCHVRLNRGLDPEEAVALYRDAYASEPFVRVLEDGLPATRSTLGSNFCDVSVRVDPERRMGVAMAALDNLGKGAAGQAVQNVNAMFQIDEEEGLWRAPTFP